MQVYPLDIFRNISLMSNVFIEIHEYSNKFVFISAHKVRVLCRSITLISSFSTLRQLSTEMCVIIPRHKCRGVYSFRLSVRLFVRYMFVCLYFRHVRGICVKVLRQSFSSGVYLSNYLSESIHIWTIVTLEGWHSLYDPGPHGPCPWVGLEVKI